MKPPPAKIKFSKATEVGFKTRQRLPGATIQALRKGTLPEDVKTVALVEFTRAVVKQRIWV